MAPNATAADRALKEKSTAKSPKDRRKRSAACDSLHTQDLSVIAGGIAPRALQWKDLQSLIVWLSVMAPSKFKRVHHRIPAVDIDRERVFQEMTKEVFQKEFGEPLELKDNYNYVVTYSYPGPLDCSSGADSGCSDIVDAGPSVGGTGRFCDYLVLCAGTTVTIFYNRFELVA